MFKGPVPGMKSYEKSLGDNPPYVFYAQPLHDEQRTGHQRS
ncbi:MAG: hypothetical protein V2J12_09865 [Gammaproteobacteria bacterium]|jgi:hypothetical protein|nr:hypothetical protein [Gammaproteobacteria bacterium]